MSSAEIAERPDSIGIQFPADWTALPMDATSFRKHRDDAIEDLRRAGGTERAQERQLEVFLARLHRRASRANASLVAGFATVDGGEGDTPTVYAAGCTISTMDREWLGADVPLSVDVVLRACTQGPRDPEGAPTTMLSPPSVVDLGELRGVRLQQSIRSADSGSPVCTRSFAQSYFVPDRRGDRVVIVHFVTPNAAFAQEFGRLFEAIAGTLRLFYPDVATMAGGVLAGA